MALFNKPQKNNLLKSLHIEAPCNISWNSMQGNDQVRRCSQCNKNVYNISAMTETEVEQFLQVTQYQACVNFYRRLDNTILLSNCPKGLKTIYSHYKKVAALIATAISLCFGSLLNSFAGEKTLDSNQKPARLDRKLTSIPLPGTPALPAHFLATSEYRYNANSLIDQIMAKSNISAKDLKGGAFSLYVNTAGVVESIHIVNPPANKKVEKLVLQKLKNIKLPALPKKQTTTIAVYHEFK